MKGRDIERDAVLDFVSQLPQKEYSDHLPDTESSESATVFGDDRKIRKTTVMDKRIFKEQNWRDELILSNQPSSEKQVFDEAPYDQKMLKIKKEIGFAWDGTLSRKIEHTRM